MIALTRHVLDLDYAAEIARITSSLQQTLRELNKRGLVVATSGGIDSSVCAALAARAIGPSRVFCVFLPERDGSLEPRVRVHELFARLGTAFAEQDITPVLEAVGCYERRDAAVRAVFPDYTSEWRFKLSITGGLSGRYNTFNLVAQRPGTPPPPPETRPLPAAQFFEIVGRNFNVILPGNINQGLQAKRTLKVAMEFDLGHCAKHGAQIVRLGIGHYWLFLSILDLHPFPLLA